MRTKLLVSALLLTVSGAASATTVAITSYDITNAYVTGSGGWAHTYSGTITPVSGFVANYTGGSGTLNDGIVGTSVSANQLFNNGNNLNVVITLHLDGFYAVNSILLQGGNDLSNTIPGLIYGLNVGINGVTQGFTTTAQGLAVYSGLADDYVGLAGSSLAGLMTNTIVLSGFNSLAPDWNRFSITEIVIDGTRGQVSVPEPSVLTLFGLGLFGVGFVSRRQKMR